MESLLERVRNTKKHWVFPIAATAKSGLCARPKPVPSHQRDAFTIQKSSRCPIEQKADACMTFLLRESHLQSAGRWLGALVRPRCARASGSLDLYSIGTRDIRAAFFKGGLTWRLRTSRRGSARRTMQPYERNAIA